jgi:hypothetical protein
MSDEPYGEERMFDQIQVIENEFLDRLTESRRSGETIEPEVEELLSSSGIYWDTIAEEYFVMEVFQKETFKRLAEEYASKDYS